MDPSLPQPLFTPMPSGQAEPREFSSELQPGKLSACRPQRWGQTGLSEVPQLQKIKAFILGGGQERTRIISNVLSKTLN